MPHKREPPTKSRGRISKLIQRLLSCFTGMEAEPSKRLQKKRVRDKRASRTSERCANAPTHQEISKHERRRGPERPPDISPGIKEPRGRGPQYSERIRQTRHHATTFGNHELSRPTSSHQCRTITIPRGPSNVRTLQNSAEADPFSSAFHSRQASRNSEQMLYIEGARANSRALLVPRARDFDSPIPSSPTLGPTPDTIFRALNGTVDEEAPLVHRRGGWGGIIPSTAGTTIVSEVQGGSIRNGYAALERTQSVSTLSISPTIGTDGGHRVVRPRRKCKRKERTKGIQANGDITSNGPAIPGGCPSREEAPDCRVQMPAHNYRVILGSYLASSSSRYYPIPPAAPTPPRSGSETSSRPTRSSSFSSSHDSERYDDERRPTFVCGNLDTEGAVDTDVSQFNLGSERAYAGEDMQDVQTGAPEAEGSGLARQCSWEVIRGPEFEVRKFRDEMMDDTEEEQSDGNDRMVLGTPKEGSEHVVEHDAWQSANGLFIHLGDDAEGDREFASGSRWTVDEMQPTAETVVDFGS
ncbi:hypothetical protein DFH27DRAFT_615053 [Peziza echinospora]|nr:hypothetical protein DFH27DRAFT_615053 [Peziza echinospora]